MSLTAGTRLGPYEIIAPIGAGGMGEVYKARDTRLDRIVAVKVSNQQFSERFEREARAVAALNHSNICTLHDVGPNYLVMEYIEGSPLKGPVPLDQALKYAGQICDALDAAHKKGITHRDLKPANILVTKSGIKLLDFGLAKLNIQSGGENTPTRTLHDTGGVVGTPAYMAPEQWEGKPADARTDVYGFGCVLYELLTGERAMRVAGQNTSALDSQPQLIQRVIHACLAQDPDDRWQSAKDIRKALDLAASQVPAPVAAKQSKAGLIGWIAAGVFAIAAGALAYMHAQQKPPESPVVRFTIPPPVKHGYGLPTISPDGRRIAFTAAESQGKLSLWVRDLNSTAPKALAGTEGSEFTTWSPDGRYVAFTSQTQLKKVNVDTGIIEPICDLASFVQGLAWTPDGQIIVGLNLDSIHIVPDGGGALKTLLTLDQSRKETRQYWPTLTPDGKHVFYLVTSALPEVAGIWVASVANPADRHRVLPDPSQAAYSQGHLLFVRKGNLVAQPFDLDALKVTGEAQPIVEDVTYNAAAGFADFTVSPNGVLAIGAHEQPSKLMTFDRAGNIQKIFGAGARRYQIVNISPDQSKVAADAPGDPGYELFVFDPARDATSQVTVGANTGNFPVWSPDGTKLAFGSNREGVYNIYLKPASGGAGDQVLLKNSANKFVMDWSRDGRYLIYGQNVPAATRREDLWVLPMPEGGPAKPFVEDDFDKREAKFSWDGRWVAYSATETLRPEVFVRAFPSGANKLQVSTEGGTRPRWRDDGKELYYIDASGRLLAVELSSPAPDRLEVGVPKVLFEVGMYNSLVSYDVYKGGQRFVMGGTARAIDEPVSVILNWSGLLRASPK